MSKRQMQVEIDNLRRKVAWLEWHLRAVKILAADDPGPPEHEAR